MQNCTHSSFSQRRFLGFRNHFEFDSKRLLIANKTKVKVLSITQTPTNGKTKVKTNSKGQGNQTGANSLFNQGGLLCCNNQSSDHYAMNMANPTEQDQPRRSRQMKVGTLDLASQNSNVKLMCEWALPYNGTSEKIVYASFLEDINPNQVFVVTSDPELQTSRIYILTVNTRSEAERVSFRQEDESLSSSSNEQDEEKREETGGFTMHSMQSNEENDHQLKQKLYKQLNDNNSEFKLRKFVHDENYVLQLDEKRINKVINTKIET